MHVNLLKKRRKVFYPIGLLSLLFIPFICIWMLNRNQLFDDSRLLTVYWWNQEFYENNPEFFPEGSHPKINYIYINLNGNELHDELKLVAAQYFIRWIVKSKSQDHGVHFKFGKKAEFWTFIKAVNICNIENLKVFVPFENDLWALNLRCN